MLFCGVEPPAKAEHRGDSCETAEGESCKLARRRDIVGAQDPDRLARDDAGREEPVVEAGVVGGDIGLRACAKIRRPEGQDHRLSHAVEEHRNHQTHQPKSHGKGGGILQRVEFTTPPAKGGDGTADCAKQKCCCPDHKVPFAADAGSAR